MTDPYDLLPLVADVMDDDVWEGDPAPTFDQRIVTLNALQSEERCEQSIRALRNLDSRKAALVAEMDRLKAKLNAVENRRESVRDYLRSVMVLMGTRKVKTTIATASLSAGRERIVLDDANMAEHVKHWPSEVVAAAVTYPPPKIDKTALKEIEPITVLANLPGVSVEVGEDVLTIR